MSISRRRERFHHRSVGLAATTLALLSVLAFGGLVNGAGRGFVWQIDLIGGGITLAGSTSLALDSIGRPHIAFADVGPGVVRYVRWNGETWDAHSVPSSGFAYGAVSLTLDARDRPHLSFFDIQSSRIKYAHLAEFGWRIVAVDNALDEGHHSIGLDADGIPHIAYSWNNGYLRYARLQGSAWVTETVDEDVVTSRYTSIALDASGDPRIGYYAKGNLYYAHWAGSRWDIQTVENGSNPQYVALRIGSDGVVKMAYRNETTSDVRLAVQNGSDWQIVTVDREGEPGWDLRMALDAGNRPHLSYYDRTLAVLKYARLEGTVWRINAVDVTRTSGWWSDVAVGPDGRPHFAYYIYAEQTVRYATGVDGFAVRTWPARSVTATTAVTQAELTGLGSVTQALLAIEWRPEDGAWQRLAETSLTAPGVVVATLDRLTPETAYEVRAVAVIDGAPVYGETKGFSTPRRPPEGLSLPMEVVVPVGALASVLAVLAVYFVRQRRRGAA